MSSESEFQSSLTPEALRPLQIVCLAVAMGPVMFGGVVLYLALGGGLAKPEAPQDDPAGLVRLLTYAHLAVALGSWSAAATIPGLMLRELGKSPQPLARLRGATILRLALLEGPALFGWVVCLLAAQNGVLADAPIYWANGLSTLVLLAGAAATFPSRERLLGLFRRLGP